LRDGQIMMLSTSKVTRVINPSNASFVSQI
jgi:hypothetical protein